MASSQNFAFGGDQNSLVDPTTVYKKDHPTSPVYPEGSLGGSVTATGRITHQGLRVAAQMNAARAGSIFGGCEQVTGSQRRSLRVSKMG